MSDGIKKITEYLFKDGRYPLINSKYLPKIDEIEPGSLYYMIPSKQFLIKEEDGTDFINLELRHFFNPKSITSLFLGDECVIESKIADQNITTNKYKDRSITSIKIDKETILTDNIADNQITTVKIADRNVTTEKIAEQAITNKEIADKTIITNNIAKDAITTEVIMNKTVTEEKIADGAITTIKVANKSITTEKIADGAITVNQIAPGTINSNVIADRSITGIKIALQTLKGENIANNTIDSSNIAKEGIESVNLKNGCIITNKISDYNVTTNKIANNAITKNKLEQSIQKNIDNAIKLVNGEAVCNGNFKCTGNVNVSGSITTVGNITANKVHHAVYNDLAEGYIPGEYLRPGDIVSIRKDGKVYKSLAFCENIIGVVSDEYAVCYGATEEEIKTGKKVAVGLIGKVHVTVEGPVKLGDRIISKGDGIGIATKENLSRYIIGKVIEEDNKKNKRKVLCLIRPN